MIRIGVVGYGYWGPNLVRNFAETNDAEVVACSDMRPARLQLVQKRFPAVRVTTDPQALCTDPAVDAVAIATPVSTHFDLAMQALQNGKHVLVEKPLTATAAEATQLIQEAERRKLTLMVDHTFVYTGQVRKMHDLVHNGSLGDIYYYDSVRVNLGLFQHDVNVIWDLAVHDLSIMNYLLPQSPVAVSATGMSHVPGQPENVAYLTLFFDDCLIAHIHVNWLAPVKIRKTLIGGSRKMIVYDDLEPTEKIKVYDKGITVNKNGESIYDLLVGYRAGDMWAPQFDTTEALRGMASHFVNCISKGERPITDGVAGHKIVQVLEAATQSMAARGRPVELER